MPANRSRTQEWRKCLQQIHTRGGALEIAVSPAARSDGGAPNGAAETAPAEGGQLHADLIWRVRVLELNEDEVVVEQPMALGRSIQIEVGTNLVAIIAIGQNRWMFRSTNLGNVTHGNSARPVPALRIRLPETVERCQRRNFYRVETASVTLPVIEMWPLLDPKSVVLAERASELRAQERLVQGAGESSATNVRLPNGKPLVPQGDEIMPEVGPRFSATMLNVGGGGLGARVSAQESQHLLRHKIFWLRIPLMPVLAEPICVTGKVVHTHIESTHDTYAGLSFDFTFNPHHQRFVAQQICTYIAALQQSKFRSGQQRRSA